MRRPTTIQLALIIIGLFVLNSCKLADLQTQIADDNSEEYAGDGDTEIATFAGG